MTIWKKVLISIIIIYFLLAVINVTVLGWTGVGSFLTGPIYMILGIIDGFKAADIESSFQKGYEQSQDNG